MVGWPEYMFQSYVLHSRVTSKIGFWGRSYVIRANEL